MAFDPNGFSIISSTGNAPFISLQNGTNIGAPQIYTYYSNTDTLAQISAAGYFNPVVNLLGLEGVMWIVDDVAASGLYSITGLLPNVTIAHTGGLGDVVGPALSTANAIATFADASGMVLLNSLAILSPAGNLTGLTGLTVGGVIYPAAPGAAGQVLELGAGNQLVFANPTANVWVDAVATPTAIVPNTSYVADTAGLLTFNMPALVPFGTVINIAGNGAGGWLVQLNAGQTAHIGSVATAVGGVIRAAAPANQYSCISLLCTAANTTFVVINGYGNVANV
jgi:hypothetical protein